MLLLGDFNTPSHLDWTEEAKGLHCSQSFAWPVTKFLQYLGFKDSFRVLHPDPVVQPGLTWSPIFKYLDSRPNEPQDRIDFILYAAPPNLIPVASWVYTGNETIITNPPNEYQNDWPSDHAAVITDFEYSRL